MYSNIDTLLHYAGINCVGIRRKSINLQNIGVFLFKI